MNACPCGSRHIEQKELGLCASCNRARRKAENASPAKPRKPLKQTSVKMGVTLGSLKEAYKQVDARVQHCEGCGGEEALTHSHCLTQKQFPAHRDNPRNVQLLCLECHGLLENNKTVAAKRLACWPEYLAIVKELEPEYYALLNLKNPTLYP